jgi:toxin ParE1/3/4
LRLEQHPDAIAGAREARLRYAERSQDVAVAFFGELEPALASVQDGLMRWPAKFGVRRLVMRRFPFTIAYRAFELKIEVIAVAHGRRKPGYWRSR